MIEQAEPPRLKTDVLGRVLTSAERREALLDEFEKSGVSGKQFAALVGVNYQTFATWIQSRRRRRGDYEAIRAAKLSATATPKKDATKRTAAALPLRWLEAVVEEQPRIDEDAAASVRVPATAAGNAPALCVHLPGGARLEIADPTQVALAAELLRSLEKPARAEGPC